MQKLFKRELHLRPSIILLILAVLFGGYARLQNAFSLTFPLNDGGMFFTMTQNLIDNGFRLPYTTNYNHLNIPFAYPPLQFYITGGLSTLFNWPLIEIFRFFPAFFALLNIPAFFWLANELTRNETLTGLATLIFALIPSTFDWLIMGGGITRSPAFFFALLSLVYIYRLYNRDERKYIWITSLFCSITVLSHPETALHTAASALIFFLFFGRNKQGVKKSLLVAGLTLLFTSPWWISVLLQHGLTPFLAAGQTGFHGLTSLLKLFVTNLISEYGLTSISILALVGITFYASQKRFFLPVWFLVIYFSEPRSAPLYMTPLIAIFAAYALIKILGMINGFEQKPSSETDLNLLFSGLMTKILVAVLLGQWLFSAFSTTDILAKSYYLSESDRKAFQWIKENTQTDSKFLILTGTYPLTDPVSEWFPTFSERSSVNTAQGYEWVANTDFEQILNQSLEIQQCLTQSVNCINLWLKENIKSIEHIYLSHSTIYDNQGELLYRNALAEELINSNNFGLIYDVDGVMLFKLNR